MTKRIDPLLNLANNLRLSVRITSELLRERQRLRRRFRSHHVQRLGHSQHGLIRMGWFRLSDES